MVTPYDQINGNKSLAAHRAARESVYPLIFSGSDSFSLEHKDGTEVDLKNKIDVIAKVKWFDQEHPTTYTIQERWREHGYSAKRDLTVTKINRLTNKPAEYFDGEMQFFLYGYYNYESGKFGEVVFVDFSRVRYLVDTGVLIEADENSNGKKQDFVCFSFNSLHLHGCVLWTNNKLAYPSADSVSDYWRRLYLDSRGKNF